MKTDAIDAGIRAAEVHIQLGDKEGAIVILTWVSGLDPLNDSSWYLLMKTLVMSQRTASAVQVYKEFETLLHKDLGMEPAGEIRSLYDSLSEGQIDLAG